MVIGCSKRAKTEKPPAADIKRGVVTISYDLYRIRGPGSNQIAVWIEDLKGNYIKTIYATEFMTRGGYTYRPTCGPRWRKASDWENASSEEVDAVSGATQAPGRNSLVWDCTDNKGKPIAYGTYIYKIEGNILYDNVVLWIGNINVGLTADSSKAIPEYFPETATDKSDLVLNVKASFEPEK